MALVEWNPTPPRSASAARTPSAGTRPSTASLDAPTASEGRRDPGPATSTTRQPAGHACPLCGYTDETKASAYTHLQLSHRKRAISSALLEAYAGVGPDSEPAEPAEPESAPAVED